MKLAIFDLDETLIAGDSARLWLEYLVDRKLISADILAQEKSLMAAYYQGQLDMDAYMALTLAPIRYWQADVLTPLVEDFVQHYVLPLVYGDAQARLHWHLTQGHTVVIISATGEHLVKPIARALGVEHAIGILLDYCDGAYTGLTRGVHSYQEGKLTRLQEWMQQQGITPSTSYGYSDSLNDLPLLEYVDQAAVVNGDNYLYRIAAERGWELLTWR
ncbi:hydrolase [Oceanisphaera profunda]|uniref:Hydrolase n=1 Tax=Oceanisphaera profunda TaxID=1416627 RepID=A0A1Y0D7T9_9GAMM|nr:HAD family hydrolase [Oceanisphaera profunda]ART83608.1 hydrolase [Oceanisphaera profunda]